MSKVRHTVAVPVEYEDNGQKKTRWVTIGSAFINDKSIQVLLDALPVGRKLVIFPPKEDKQDQQVPFE